MYAAWSTKVQWPHFLGRIFRISPNGFRTGAPKTVTAPAAIPHASSVRHVEYTFEPDSGKSAAGVNHQNRAEDWSSGIGMGLNLSRNRTPISRLRTQTRSHVISTFSDSI
jgi:hypothetical protein